MPVSQPTIIDRLEREWDELVRRGIADQALSRWRRRSAALEFETAGALVDALADQTLEPVERNEILAALVELAPSDQLAARLVLHRFLPCLKTLVQDHDPVDAEEWVAILVAIAYEVICSYPVGDRPSHVPSNLAREIRRRALRTLADRRRCARELSDGIDAVQAVATTAGHDPYTAVDLKDFLAWAMRRRLVDRRTVDLVLRTRIGGVTVAAVAAARREAPATVRQRRRRAERRLAVALASVA